MATGYNKEFYSTGPWISWKVFSATHALSLPPPLYLSISVSLSIYLSLSLSLSFSLAEFHRTNKPDYRSWKFPNGSHLENAQKHSNSLNPKSFSNIIFYLYTIIKWFKPQQNALKNRKIHKTHKNDLNFKCFT